MRGSTTAPPESTPPLFVVLLVFARRFSAEEPSGAINTSTAAASTVAENKRDDNERCMLPTFDPLLCIIEFIAVVAVLRDGLYSHVGIEPFTTMADRIGWNRIGVVCFRHLCFYFCYYNKMISTVVVVVVCIWI